jgi:hypothetical protein
LSNEFHIFNAFHALCFGHFRADAWRWAIGTSGRGWYIPAPSQSGDTALIRAAEGGHTDCVRLLVEAGADMNILNNVRTQSNPRCPWECYSSRAYFLSVQHCAAEFIVCLHDDFSTLLSC